MPEASQTSKRVREPDEEGKEIEKKKKYSENEELDSCVAHLREKIEEEGELRISQKNLGYRPLNMLSMP